MAVPTPVNQDHTPNLTPVEGANRILGRNITKIVSGMDAEALEEIKKVYDLVIEVSTYPVAPNKTAEAIKVVVPWTNEQDAMQEYSATLTKLENVKKDFI